MKACVSAKKFLRFSNSVTELYVLLNFDRYVAYENSRSLAAVIRVGLSTEAAWLAKAKRAVVKVVFILFYFIIMIRINLRPI